MNSGRICQETRIWWKEGAEFIFGCTEDEESVKVPVGTATLWSVGPGARKVRREVPPRLWTFCPGQSGPDRQGERVAERTLGTELKADNAQKQDGYLLCAGPGGVNVSQFCRQVACVVTAAFTSVVVL